MTQIRGARVLVTGASRGIGEVLVRRLVQEGAHVGLVARGAAALEALALELGTPGQPVVALPADLSDADAVDGLIPRAVQALGGIDILIHNAGIEPYGAFELAERDVVDKVLAVNLRAPIQLTRAALPGMLAQGHGHILFTGSTSGLFAAPFATTYGATKAAIGGLSRSLAVELADRGIRSTVIQPGFVEGTGMFEDWRQGAAVRPPWFVGSTTADRVVEAMVQALRHDTPEVTVNSMPMAPAIALTRLLPALGVRVMRAAFLPFMARLAHDPTVDQGSKR